MKRHLPFLCCLILPLVALYQISSILPWQLMLGYGLLISATTIGSNWQDKRSAQKDRWRIPENTLHTFELLGGWPAAYLAQQLFRHKTSKRSYRSVFWWIVALYQFVALEWLTDWRISHWALSFIESFAKAR